MFKFIVVFKQGNPSIVRQINMNQFYSSCIPLIQRMKILIDRVAISVIFRSKFGCLQAKKHRMTTKKKDFYLNCFIHFHPYSSAV